MRAGTSAPKAPKFVLAPPGFIVVSQREDMLYAIIEDGDAVPLNVRVERSPAGIEALAGLSDDERVDLLEACARSAHESWLEEKLNRLRALHFLPEYATPDTHPGLTWKSETGEEQLVPWELLVEDVREFDRIVVAGIMDVLRERGLAR